MMDTPVRIPICPAEHFFMTFKPIAGNTDISLVNGQQSIVNIIKYTVLIGQQQFNSIPELEDKKLPNVRDYDSQVYVRQFGSSYMMGAFETLAR